jgi:hypothetical protein
MNFLGVVFGFFSFCDTFVVGQLLDVLHANACRCVGKGVVCPATIMDPCLILIFVGIC